MKRTNLNNLLLFSGSSIVLTMGLLVAFTPGLAYTTVHSYFIDVPNPPFELPYVGYQPLNFSTHIYTVRFLCSAIGGLIGLFALLWKNRKAYVGVVAIGLAIMGLMLPAVGATISFPALYVYNIPWIGSLIIVIGISLMFLALTKNKERVPKASFVSLPLLLAVYLIPLIFIMFNYLSWILLWGETALNPIGLLIWLIPLASFLLMAWGALTPKRKETTRLFRD